MQTNLQWKRVHTWHIAENVAVHLASSCRQGGPMQMALSSAAEMAQGSLEDQELSQKQATK